MCSPRDWIPKTDNHPNVLIGIFVKQLSSKAVFYKKFVLPMFLQLIVGWGVLLFWFEYRGKTFSKALRDPSPEKYLGALFLLLMPVVALPFVMHFFPKLVDEVHDCGDSLLVKNQGATEQVPLANIQNVNAQQFWITLQLVRPGKFGSEVSFAATGEAGADYHAQQAIADDLIARVVKAREARTVS